MEDHEKFFAAHPADRIGPARLVAQQARNTPQHRVPRVVPVSVVDVFEMVDVNHRHG